MTVTTVSALFRDMYPRAGERIKQWVVDQRKQTEWGQATCPRVGIAGHNDNTGDWCRNSGAGARWIDMEGHDCCGECNDMAEHTRMRPDIVAWLAERDARPKPTSDRTLLSDEIAPDIALTDHPMLRMLGGKR